MYSFLLKAWKEEKMIGRMLDAATEATTAVTELYSNSSARIDYSGSRRLRGHSFQRVVSTSLSAIAYNTRAVLIS